MRSDARIKLKAGGGMGHTGKKSAPGIVAAAGFFGMLAAFPGFADAPADTGELGEIVVTAQRRTERLMDVPMSIQAFSQEKSRSTGGTLGR